MQDIGNSKRGSHCVLTVFLDVCPQYPENGSEIMNRELMIEVARLLNQSNLYKCGFIVVGESIYALGSTRVNGQCDFWEIDPACYLKEVRARVYE